MVKKKSSCNAGDMGSIPVYGISSGEGHDNLLQYACLENPMDRGAQQGRTKLDMTEVTQYACARNKYCLKSKAKGYIIDQDIFLDARLKGKYIFLVYPKILEQVLNYIFTLMRILVLVKLFAKHESVKTDSIRPTINH